MRHKKSTVNRSFRVADQIQRDVAELIRDLKDPRVGMVTINSVEVSPDYAHAQIYFSVLVGSPEDCTLALNEAAGFLRVHRRYLVNAAYVVGLRSVGGRTTVDLGHEQSVPVSRRHPPVVKEALVAGRRLER